MKGRSLWEERVSFRRVRCLFVLVVVASLMGAAFLIGCSAASPSPTPTPQLIGPPISPAPAPTPPINIESVIIANFSFKPHDLTIPSGTVVLWTNNDDVDHNITGPDFILGPFGKGQAWAHTFNVEGVFSYYCGIHPQMTGSVTVKGR